MNVVLETPPSEQSVHVAVRMPMPLQLLSCWFAGHAMHGNEHQSHGTLAGSKTACQTCNGAAEGSSHGLSMAVTAWPPYVLGGVRDGWNASVKCGKSATSYGDERQCVSSYYQYACVQCAGAAAEHLQGRAWPVFLILLLGGSSSAYMY